MFSWNNITIKLPSPTSHRTTTEHHPLTWLTFDPLSPTQGVMMCEVMPTISEDTAQRGSQSSASDPDSHFEQLMVNMLDERDRLLDTLRETQESLGMSQQHLEDVIYDRDSLQRQLSSALPQVTYRSTQEPLPS